MWRSLRKFLIGSILVIVCLVTLLFVLASIFEDEINESLLAQIKTSVETEMQIESFDLSLLSAFPSASARFEGVTIKDHDSKDLLKAEQIALKIDLWGIFREDYKIQSVSIKNGRVNLLIDKKGKPNYVVWKSIESNEEDAVKVSLKEAELDHIRIIYDDQKNDQLYDVDFGEASVTGDFTAKKFFLNVMATSQVHVIDVNGQNYLTDKAVICDAELSVDLEKGIQRLEKVNLGINENVFTISGVVNTASENKTFVDLQLKNKSGDLFSLVQVLPTHLAKYFEDYESAGKFSCDGTIKGNISKLESPAIDFNILLENGRIKSTYLDSPLKDVSLSAFYTNGEKHNNESSVFFVDKLNGVFGKDKISCSIKVVNFDHPILDIQADGDIPLATISPFFNLNNVTASSGQLEVRDFQLKGRVSDMMNPQRTSRVVNNGHVKFDDAKLEWANGFLSFDEGSLTLKENNVNIDRLKIEAPGTEMVVDGNFLNLLPVLLSDRKNSKKAQLKFKAQLLAEKLDLEQLFNLSRGDVSDGKLSEIAADSIHLANNQRRERITRYLDGRFTARIKNFNYNKIEAKDFEGDLDFEHNELFINGDVETMGGILNLEGQVWFKERPYLKATVIANKIDVTKCFYQCENFGQKFIVDKNISGTLNANVVIHAYWDKEGNYLDDKLYVLSEVHLANGELNRFKLLYDFSDYIKLADLRHIRFSHLQNFLEIKNRKIYLPVMYIESNAANMAVKGEHTFDNEIDYKIKINAGQVLLNKFKKKNPKHVPLQSKRHGWFNLYYAMKGTTEKFDITSNKRAVKKDFCSE